MTITGRPVTNLPEAESVTNEDLLVVYKDGVAKRAAASMFRGDTGTFSPEDLQRVTDLESGKVDKVSGKGLSTNDYTDADKAKVAAALTQHQDISGKVDKVSGKGLSTNDYTDADKAKVAAALTQHQDISGKVDKVTGKGLSTNDYTNADKAKVAAALTQHQDISGKVDKVTGKGLSTNDYTTAEKNKLLGIEAGAQVNEVTSEHYRSMMAMLNIIRLQDAGFQKQFENFRAVFDNFLYVQDIPVYMTAVGVGVIEIRDAAAGQVHSITVDRSLSGQRLYVQLANSSGIADTNVTVNSDGVALVSLATVKGVNTLYVTTSAYTFPPASGGGHGGHQGATYINLHTDENGQFAYDYWIPNHGVEAKVRYVQDSELGNEIARTVTYEDFLATLGLSVTYSVTDNPAAMQSAGKQLYLKLDGYPFGTQGKPTYAKTSYPNAQCNVYYVAEYHQLML